MAARQQPAGNPRLHLCVRVPAVAAGCTKHPQPLTACCTSATCASHTCPKGAQDCRAAIHNSCVRQQQTKQAAAPSWSNDCNDCSTHSSAHLQHGASGRRRSIQPSHRQATASAVPTCTSLQVSSTLHLVEVVGGACGCALVGGGLPSSRLYRRRGGQSSGASVRASGYK